MSDDDDKRPLPVVPGVPIPVPPEQGPNNLPSHDTIDTNSQHVVITELNIPKNYKEDG